MRKGSALLIVLGLLSFMVVSAVSFSIYMRQSRLPSSYLRRNIAARYLVRAALARAIDELDGAYNDDENWGKYEMSETDVRKGFYGIYDDPYPGCGYKRDPQANTDGDFWFRRVFMPFGPTKYAEATVPTLTLEALAYLPPALIDDVRKFSRYTRTAAWRSLPYEAGRYAYTAVNVSDLFDVNRLRADAPRDSGPNRITLAPLCSQTAGDPFDINTDMATTLDTLQQKWSSSGYDTPFVSLADFNLLAGTSGFTPFMNYIGKTSTKLLKNGDANAANALFITDTWFPAATSVASTSGSSGSSGSSSASVTYDLAGAHQPFMNFDAKDWPSVLASRNSQDSVSDIFEKNLGLGQVALYDYLDSDQQPTSLALPTVEAVPMVTGVSCPAMLQPEIESRPEGEVVFEVEKKPSEIDPSNPEDKTWKIKRSWSKLTFTGFGNRVLTQVLMTYPFKRMETTGRIGSNFKLRGVLRVFAAPANMGCRPLDSNGNLYPSQQAPNAWQGKSARNGVASFFSEEASLDALNKDVTKTDDAIDDSVSLKFNCRDIDMPIMYVVTETCENGSGPTADGFVNNKKFLSLDGLGLSDSTFRPLTADGEVDASWENLRKAAQAAHKFEEKQLNVVTDSFAGFTGTYKLYAAVWLQVMDGNGNVVDMAPASYKDDMEFLNASGSVPQGVMARKCGDGTPLLSFCADYAVTFTEKIADDLKDSASYGQWKTLYAVDPRYNFAPEDWFAKNGNTAVSKSEWTGEILPLLGQDGRDRDIFMFVSDQEYLQSIGELQFLPVMGLMNGNENFLSGDYSPDFNGSSFASRTSASGGSFANGGRFWRTYTAYDNGDGTDPIYALPYGGNEIRFQAGVGDFKVNPYSDDDRVLSAALVGTPFDYYVASTNNNQRQVGGKKNTFIDTLDLDKSLSQCSFGEAPLAKMSADDLLSIMDNFRSVFGERAKSSDAAVVADWMGGFDKMEWQRLETTQRNDDNKAFMGIDKLAEADSSPLHQVDRKFLYSFWRECFENRQQLFLVFVRAEPMSTSGGSVGKAMPSSQLGGRAVALVWRDPAVPSYQSGERKTRQALADSTGDSVRSDIKDVREDCPPHCTRVLFYHQFE